MPNTDTLHALIREFRDTRKIPLNVEHRLMLGMAPDYDHLTVIQKVEVFQHALESTSGAARTPSPLSGPEPLSTCTRPLRIQPGRLLLHLSSTGLVTLAHCHLHSKKTEMSALLLSGPV